MASLPAHDPDEEAGTLDRSAPEKAGRLETQTWWLRPIACGVAVLSLVGFALLDYILLQHLMGQPNRADLFVALASSPIVAITTIVIFLLIGVFRGYRSPDIRHPAMDVAVRGFGGD